MSRRWVGAAILAVSLVVVAAGAFVITTLTMACGGTNTGPAFAYAFLVGAVFAVAAMFASFRIAPRSPRTNGIRAAG